MPHPSGAMEALSTLTVPQLIWIPLWPLIAFVVLLFAGRRLGKLSAWFAIGALANSCVVTLVLARGVFAGYRLAVDWPWLSAASPAGVIGFSVDGLSWMMLFVVTFIGTCIAVYSSGYMAGDPRYSRFFAYFSLFCAAMLTLVLADHLLFLFIGWELVGLCSYLLISFWFEKPAAAAAGRKAFLTTRVGDTGLLLGIFLLATTVGTFHFREFSASIAGLPSGLLTAISLLIFLGACGKSAQIPLHVWLPDAMEGPTPVSALIHAATMVAAGVYLLARAMPLFTPESLQVVLVVGLATHLLAGSVALTMTDIKRILAYSTVSQLGLMMVAMGLNAPAVAMFHLFTHAFFKALLFLGAGSVIHATHEQELSRLGGLWRRMPWTALVCALGSLSMAGMLFMSGFWSKDAILLTAREQHPWLMWVLLGGAVMTACYVFRLYFCCFLGPEPQAHGDHHAHESPPVMVAPMLVLAVGAVAAGLVGSPWLGSPIFHLLQAHAHEHVDLPVLIWSTAALLTGMGLAWVVGFQGRNLVPGPLRPAARRLYALAANKYYVDEIYQRCIIEPALSATRALSEFDRRVIDGAVNGAGTAGWRLSQWKERFDRLVVDRIVNGLAETVREGGAVMRRAQTGIIQQYLFVVVGAVVALAVLVRL